MFVSTLACHEHRHQNIHYPGEDTMVVVDSVQSILDARKLGCSRSELVSIVHESKCRLGLTMLVFVFSSSPLVVLVSFGAFPDALSLPNSCPLFPFCSLERKILNLLDFDIFGFSVGGRLWSTEDRRPVIIGHRWDVCGTVDIVIFCKDCP